MTVRIGRMAFSDWISLSFAGGWSDTFIFRVDPLACIPPFEYAPPLKRMAAHVQGKRPGASLWVQVEGTGEWFLAELRRCLRGLRLPFAITHLDASPSHLRFSVPPRLWREPQRPPPSLPESFRPLLGEELRCLQALCRMKQGDGHETASLAGLSVGEATIHLHDLASKGLIVCLDGTQSSFIPSARGLSLALRSWNIPSGVAFTSRQEENLQDIGSKHRHLARLWPSWLKSAWPQAEVWTGWSEVRVPEVSVIPDGLAWGRFQGYETLFWLEVGDGHKSRAEITEVTARRLKQAQNLCARTGMRLVYVQLSPPWVHAAARWGCMNLSEDVAVVLGDWRQFGRLPMADWGRVAG